ncbi:hypothetical protein NDU88_001120, partial [Pleurodeles waltl]
GPGTPLWNGREGGGGKRLAAALHAHPLASLPLLLRSASSSLICSRAAAGQPLGTQPPPVLCSPTWTRRRQKLNTHPNHTRKHLSKNTGQESGPVAPHPHLVKPLPRSPALCVTEHSEPPPTGASPPSRNLAWFRASLGLSSSSWTPATPSQ